MANKLAIVTGASTGIGYHLAQLAAEDGYHLIVAADEPLINVSADDFRRTGNEVPWTEGRDKWWHEETAKVPNYCPPEIMASEDPLFILYVRARNPPFVPLD